MQYRVLVENPSPDLFTATIMDWPDCVIQAHTEEEAIAAARTALKERLNRSKIVTIDLTDEAPAATDRWLSEFGRFREDPTFDDFTREMATARAAEKRDNLE